MSKILLVDDEILVIEAIKCNIDWDACGITDVYMCDNGFQAQKIMQENAIDIVISDIQMPGIDGIGFATWIKSNYPKCGLIFITGFAEFEYAKAAITLGAEDYILKPVNYQALQEKITDFMKKLRSVQKDEMIKQQFEIHKEDLIKEWAQYVLQSEEEYYETDLEKLLDRFHVELSFQDKYILLWLELNSILNWEHLEALKYELPDIINTEEREIIFTKLSEKRFFAMIRLSQNSHAAEIEEIRRKVADSVADISVPCCCYLTELLNVDQIIPMLRKISERGKRNVLYQNKVILVGNRNIPTMEKKIDVDYKRWVLLLEANDITQLEELIEFTIHSIVIEGSMDVEILRDLYNHFVQMMYYYIGEEYDGRQAIIQDETLVDLQTNALNSVRQFREYYHYFLEKIISYQANQHSNNVVCEVKKYIDEHIGEKITRAQIAEHVFLNENYLSRLFHKEVGCSISNYILEKRLAMSKKMLIQSKLSVSEIGERVGYDTTTYFIRIFKQETGKTPNEYRKDMRI